MTVDIIRNFDATYVSRKLVNGSFQETFDALVTSDGATIAMSLEQSGGGDLTMQFSDGNTVLDTTPALTIELTAGSDSSPAANYIYILQSDKILTKSTSDWPSVEHIKISYFLVPSASFVQSDGSYINQNWNDHLKGTDNMGHLLHITEKIRRLTATYFSGVDGNGTDNYLSPTAGNVELKSTSGIIYQMHSHTFPAFDTSSGDMVLVKNWFGDAFHGITNLYDITDDSTGTTITNNKHFNLVIWGVANKTGEYEPLMINLPGGFYNTQSSAESDVDGFDDFTMPRNFNRDSSTGFLIARITIKMKTGGGTWVVKSTTDLRGLTPGTASGGIGGVITNFADNQFTIFDEADITKIMAFDVGTLITTGNTRTYKAPDSDGTLPLLELGQTWSGQQTLDLALKINADTNQIVLDADGGSPTTITAGGGAIAVVLTLPGEATTIAGLAVADTWTAKQTFDAGFNVLDDDIIGLGNLNQGSSDAGILYESSTNDVVFRENSGAGNQVDQWRFDDADVNVTKELKGARLLLSAGHSGSSASSNQTLKSAGGVGMGNSGDGYVAIRAGSIVGASILTHITAHAGNGTIDYEIKVNNTAVFVVTLTITGTGRISAQGTQLRGFDTFSAGDLIKMHMNYISGDFTFDDSIGLCEIVFDT